MLHVSQEMCPFRHLKSERYSCTAYNVLEKCCFGVCFEFETKAADGQLARLKLVKSLMYRVEFMADLGRAQIEEI